MAAKPAMASDAPASRWMEWSEPRAGMRTNPPRRAPRMLPSVFIAEIRPSATMGRPGRTFPAH
jgi:hypothetical protein